MMNPILIHDTPIRPHAKNGRIGWVQREAVNQMLLGRVVTVTSLRLYGKARLYSARYISSIRNLVDANPTLFEAGSFGPRGGYGFRKKEQFTITSAGTVYRGKIVHHGHYERTSTRPQKGA